MLFIQKVLTVTGTGDGDYVVLVGGGIEAGAKAESSDQIVNAASSKDYDMRVEGKTADTAKDNFPIDGEVTQKAGPIKTSTSYRFKFGLQEGAILGGVFGLSFLAKWARS